MFYFFRFEIDGQLSVTLLSTGGFAVEHMRGQSTTHVRLTLNTPLMVGNLPPGYQVCYYLLTRVISIYTALL